MAILGRWTGMVSGDYTPGEHVYHHIMTPPEFRPRWFLSDVPEFIRIDHPNRPAAKEGNAGGGYKGAETRARKAAAKAAKALQEPKAKKAPRPHAGGQKGHAVWVWKDGFVHGYESLVVAKKVAGFSFGATSGPDFRDRGWVRFPRSGIVVWRQDVEVPDCVPRPFDFSKQGVSA